MDRVCSFAVLLPPPYPVEYIIKLPASTVRRLFSSSYPVEYIIKLPTGTVRRLFLSSYSHTCNRFLIIRFTLILLISLLQEYKCRYAPNISLVFRRKFYKSSVSRQLRKNGYEPTEWTAISQCNELSAICISTFLEMEDL